jgi:N-dimethylarginine dimethylaminohydrolase
MVMFDVQNEYDQLRHVILGTGLGMKPEADPKLQAGLPKTSFIYSQPDPTVTEREFMGVLKAMRELNIKVERPNLVDSPQITDQTCPRDIGFVIDSLYFKARSRFASRNSEHQGIDHLLAGFEKNAQIEIPEKLFLEGGDVVLAPGRVFVGLGARSSREGIDWLAAVLQKRNIKREIIIVPHDVLHLDCCWNVIDSNLALWCEEATGPFMDLNGKKPPLDLQTIPVNRAQQAALATNVLTVGPRQILARDHPLCEPINRSLADDFGFSVTLLSFDCVPSIGGSFRCATLPLARG